MKEVLQETDSLVESLVGKFECFGAQVLIKRLEEDIKVSPGGVAIPDVAQKRSQRGQVMLHGPGEYMSNGVFVPVQVKHGQIVLFSKYAGDDVEVEGEKYVLMHHTHVKLGEENLSWSTQAERLKCPEAFQDLLTTHFGTNRFGGPRFRLIWGQTETYDAATPYGYAKKLVGNNQPCWILQRWLPPEVFGTPEVYYALTADAETGLAMLGEYPEFGTYESVITFLYKEYDPSTETLTLRTIPLEWSIFEALIPVLDMVEEISVLEQQSMLKREEEEENARKVEYIASRMYDDLPLFYGPISYAGQINRTALIDRKAAEIERQWKQMEKTLRRQPPRRGLFQAN